MGKPTATIELDPGHWADDPQWADCRPAEGNLSGRVRVDVDEPLNPRRVILRVKWYTEGRGDRDEGIHWEEVVHQGPLVGGEEFPFEVQLPEGPLSYSGRLIKIIWAVEVHFDIAWRKDPKFEQRFRLVLA